MQASCQQCCIQFSAAVSQQRRGAHSRVPPFSLVPGQGLASPQPLLLSKSVSRHRQGEALKGPLCVWDWLRALYLEPPSPTEWCGPPVLLCWQQLPLQAGGGAPPGKTAGAGVYFYWVFKLFLTAKAALGTNFPGCLQNFGGMDLPLTRPVGSFAQACSYKTSFWAALVIKTFQKKIE